MDSISIGFFSEMSFQLNLLSKHKDKIRLLSENNEIKFLFYDNTLSLMIKFLLLNLLF
jgi:hypothetical protein